MPLKRLRPEESSGTDTEASMETARLARAESALTGRGRGRGSGKQRATSFASTSSEDSHNQDEHQTSPVCCAELLSYCRWLISQKLSIEEKERLSGEGPELSKMVSKLSV